MSDKKLCTCGCGQGIVWNRNHKYFPVKFIKGHNSKGKNNNNYGKKTSKETKEKMRQAHLEKKHTSEAKRKMSEFQKGKIVSEETKLKIKENAKINSNYGMKGKNHTKETINQILENRKWYKHSEETKRKLKKARAKQICPKKDTSIEVKIQNQLKEIGYEFFTHQYMKGIKHGYQCDILIPALNLVIECDGDYWHKYPIGTEIDHIRTKELLDKGFKVLRLWECEIKKMDSGELQFRILNVIGKN